MYNYRNFETGEYLKESTLVYSKDTNASIIELNINSDFVVSFLKNSIVIEDISNGNLVYNFLEEVTLTALPISMAVSNEFLYLSDDSGGVYC